MEITIHFEDGPIEAEIVTKDGEDFSAVLESLQEFVEEYEIQGRPIAEPAQPQETVDQPGKEDDSNTGGSESEPTIDSDDPITAKTGVSKGDIQRILKRGRVEDNEVIDFPEIIGNEDLLGDTIKTRLLHGSAIVLTVLKDYYGVDRVSTSELKNALTESGLDGSNWGNMTAMDEADVYFDRRGSGSSATIAIRQPGVEEAYEMIQELADNLYDDAEEE